VNKHNEKLKENIYNAYFKTILFKLDYHQLTIYDQLSMVINKIRTLALWFTRNVKSGSLSRYRIEPLVK